MAGATPAATMDQTLYYGSQEQSFAMAGSQEVTAGQRTEAQTSVARFEKDGGPVTHQRQEVWPLPSAGAAAGVLILF